MPKPNYCKHCDYSCSVVCNWNKHLSSQKHQKLILLYDQKMVNYQCIICDFKCSKQSNWDKHVSTAKHQKLILLSEKNAEKYNVPEIINPATENSIKNNNISENMKHVGEPPNIMLENSFVNTNVTNIDATIFVSLLQQNQKYQELIFEQNAKILELSVQPVNTTTNNNNTTNSNNNSNNTTNTQFNLNLFLNEQCKDALNLNDFIDNIIVNIEDIKYIDQFGYVDGMSNIIVRQINDTDIYKRPIHCTDLKRETMYVKNDNKWTKESPDQKNLHRIIKSTYHKNQNTMKQFFKENPDVTNTKSPEWDYYMRLLRTSMGGVNEQQDYKFADKIIRNLARTVLVCKSE